MDKESRAAFVDEAFKGAADTLKGIAADAPPEVIDVKTRAADAWTRLGAAANDAGR